MVLRGIMIAATNGKRFPVMANESPTTLYNKDNAKLIFMVFIASLDKFKK
jgi:hypothetical protein